MARIQHVACLRRTTTDELKSSAEPKRANARCSGDARSDPQHDPNCEEREAILDGCAMQCPRPDLAPRSTIAGRLNETRAPRRLRQQIRLLNCHGGILGRRIRRRTLRLMSALDFAMANPANSVDGERPREWFFATRLGRWICRMSCSLVPCH